MIKFTRYLIDEFEHPSEGGSIKFFRSHQAYGYIIWLEIIYNYLNNENITIEKIVKKGEKYSSRRRINNFLNLAEKKGYIYKVKSVSDKRNTYITPSKITTSEYLDWANKFQTYIIKK